MLLTYRVDTEEVDTITVLVFNSSVTQQLYYKGNKIIKKEEAVWRLEDSVLTGVYTSIEDILIVPPEINSERIQHVNAAAFIRVPSRVVVFPMGYKLSLDKNALLHIPEVRMHCVIKRSQITENMFCYGRILEDVYNRP